MKPRKIQNALFSHPWFGVKRGWGGTNFPSVLSKIVAKGHGMKIPGVRGEGDGSRGVKGTIAETIQTFTKMLTLGLNNML